jgi:hypothetical protein
MNAYNQEYDDSHERAESDGMPKNLGHGSYCDSCNNAVLNDMETNHRRSETFGQAINNLRSYKTDQAIYNLSNVMRRKGNPNPPKIED